MTRPVLLDFFCCQGGASAGYNQAGYRVIGSDKYTQRRYPYEFVLGDIRDVFNDMVRTYRPALLAGSPPCQARTLAARIQQNEHPNLVGVTRDLFQSTGLPYIIENVVGDPLIDEDPLIDPILLCGTSFPPLRTYRHRHFESNLPIVAPPHQKHVKMQVKMGRPLRDGDWYQAVGNFSNVPYVRENMDVPWMTRDGIRECIPPAYTAYLGRQVMSWL